MAIPLCQGKLAVTMKPLCDLEERHRVELVLGTKMKEKVSRPRM